VRLLLAAAVLGGLVLWLRGGPPATYDIRLVARCLDAEGLRVARTSGRTLSASGKVVLRLDTRNRVAFAGGEPRIRDCLDRVAGRHLRLSR